MASTNKCPLCSKGTKVSGRYSNKVRATKFNPTGNTRKYPNLQWVTLAKSMGGGRIKICTRCMKAGKQLEMVAKKVRKSSTAKKG